METDPLRYAAAALETLARELLLRARVRADIADDVASILLDGDLLGHTTHGLALLAPYLAEIERGEMARDGTIAVVSRREAAETWDAQRLPGPWCTLRALARAIELAAKQGTGTIVIRRSHHIACLAAYAKRAAERGVLALIYCSDPATASVAPFGGLTPVFTPNPLAAGIPTSRDPILLDISASLTTNGLTARLHKAGEKLPHRWLLDAEGAATDDPSVLFAEPRGTLLPLGGLEAGHKGYALALLIEAMTAGLAAMGRADPNEGWGATVFIQAIDPNSFGGAAAFARQMDWLVDACHAATPRPGVDGVRLPGEAGLARYREQRASGVRLHRTIMPALLPWCEKLGVTPPSASAS
jgi:LDH2 family malate/lactate/ureidoglycolate dehydrogenase